MDEWYYQRGEATFGPISGEMLHSLVKRGRLQAGTLARKEGVEAWSSIAEILADLPALPAAPSATAAEPYSNAQPFDASQPGASVIYAPPQSALDAQPQARLPAVLWFGMLFCSVTLVFEVICWLFVLLILFQIVDAVHWPAWLPASSRVLADGLGFQIALIASAISSISTAVWQGCAFASLKRLYGDMVRRSVASGLWWFVPIASLFMPLLCLRDMRHLSRKRRDFLGLHAPFGPLLITMEALIVIRIPLNVFEAMGNSPQAAAAPHIALEVISDVALIALATTLLAIVIGNFHQQRRLYAHWCDDALWNKYRHD